MSREGFDEDYRPLRDPNEAAPARPGSATTRDDAPSLAKNVGVFFLCCALSFVAMCLTYVVYVFEPGTSGPAPGFLCTAWMWVFMFPCMLAFALGFEAIATATLLPNPLIYGTLWWLAWRVLRLTRRRPPKGSPPPSHGG